MAIIRWTPFREMEQMMEEDDFFFPLARRGEFIPSADLYEQDNNVVAEFNLPKMKKDDLEVTIENDILRVQGYIKAEEEEKGRDYYRKESRSGTFNRSIQLPVEVDNDKVKASYKDGILKVVMPKAEETEQKKIEVEVE